LKTNHKRICILFLSLFIGTNCAAKKNLKNTAQDNNIADENIQANVLSDGIPTITDNIDNDEFLQGLSARIKYLEELLNSYQAQSSVLDSPLAFFSKKILLTNGSILYGNIAFQDDTTIQLETLIGTLAIDKETVIRVVDQAVSVLDKDDTFIELNVESEINNNISEGSNQHSAQVVLLGDFTEQKDDTQNVVLTGQVKNIGMQRADFAKITFTIYKNQSYDSVPVEYTAFINGSSVVFDNNVISTSSLYTEEVGSFSLVIPSDFGPFISYTYRIDWEEYE
tara:strand:- start:513 stop:1355 length:843 start_codon:yes stop_codon:yes gene_type:complete